MSIARNAARGLTSLPGRIMVTASLLAAVAASIDWSTLGGSLSRTSLGLFLLACLLVLAALALGALRWHLFVRGAELDCAPGPSIRAYAIGAFTNNVLPTGFGGDLVRGWIVGRSGKPLVRSLTSVGVDRVSALMCFLVLAWAGVAVDSDAIPESLVALLAIVTAGVVMAGVAVRAVLRRPQLARFVPKRLRPWTGEIELVVHGYATNRTLIVRTFVLGIAFQSFMIGASWTLAETLGLDLGPALLAVVTPLVLIATVAPISIAGFGVREGSFVVLLGEAGVSSADATLLSLLSVAAMAIASVPGGIALIVSGERPPSPAGASDR